MDLPDEGDTRWLLGTCRGSGHSWSWLSYPCRRTCRAPPHPPSGSMRSNRVQWPCGSQATGGLGRLRPLAPRTSSCRRQSICALSSAKGIGRSTMAASPPRTRALPTPSFASKKSSTRPSLPGRTSSKRVRDSPGRSRFRTSPTHVAPSTPSSRCNLRVPSLRRSFPVKMTFPSGPTAERSTIVTSSFMAMTCLYWHGATRSCCRYRASTAGRGTWGFRSWRTLARRFSRRPLRCPARQKACTSSSCART